MSKLPNIIISSWPSAGGSTAARFISLVLNFKYFDAGSVLKYWVSLMGFNPKSNDLLTWSLKYQNFWDPLWEGYIVKKIEKSNSSVFEGKTAGFFLKKRKKAFSVFITALAEVRQERALQDDRSEDIAKRDEFLQTSWKKTLGVDIFDLYEIKKNYDTVIDSSNINILQTAQEVLGQIRFSCKFNSIDFDIAFENLIEFYLEFEKDRDYLLNTIKYKGLMETPREIMLEWRKKDYNNLLKNLPEEMREVLPIN